MRIKICLIKRLTSKNTAQINAVSSFLVEELQHSHTLHFLENTNQLEWIITQFLFELISSIIN